MRYPPSLLLAVLLGLSQCKHSNPDPLSQLPDATQTGANTFGCLVNGQVLVPKGNNGTSNLYLTYDPTHRGGDFTLSVYRIDGDRRQYFTLDASPLTKAGVYSFLRPTGVCTALYTDVGTGATPGASNGCNVIAGDQDIVYRSGTLELTRFDTQARIASGTFSFKLLKANCDTLKITQGRFDVKF